MRVIPVILVIACAVHQATPQNHHHRSKNPPRGPPVRPPYPGFVKKWQQLQMANLRAGPPPPRYRPNSSPPLPLKMKKPFPLPPPQNPNRLLQQTPASSRPGAFWKKPPQRNAIPETQLVEKYPFVFPKKQQQKFLQKEYDFHVQTNQIPSGISSTLTNPIQQVGERGPIHTIPAPNLSPADKPANMDNSQFQRHHYHVTEADQAKYTKNFLKHSDDGPVYSQNVMTTSYQAQSVGATAPDVYVGTANQQTFQHPQQNIQGFKTFQTVEQDQAPQQQYVHSFQKSQLKSPGFQTFQQEQQQQQPQQQQFFQNFVHGFPKMNVEQQQSPQTFQDFQRQEEQIPHQQFLQKLPNFQVLFTDDDTQQHPQQPLFIPDSNYGQKQEINPNPEFHSFNYNEQDYQKHSKSSTVLDFEAAASENVNHRTIDGTTSTSSNNDDALARSQFIQNYFDSRQNLDTNDVENDGGDNVATPDLEEEGETPGYYSSLPNKQVADAFASLQAAGRINNSLMQLSTGEKQRPIKIYVSENSEKSKNGPEMLDYEQLDEEQQDEEEEGVNDGENSEILNSSFGDKIIPKRN